MAYRHLSSCAAVAIVTVAAAAWAAPAHADENAEARVYFDQGNRALTRGLNARGARRARYLGEALDNYVRSLSIVRSRNVVYNAGIALEALGRNDEAFRYFREYLEYDDLSEAERTEATAKLTALRTRVAVILVETDPPGAEVRIDRQDLAAVGVSPLEVAVTPGEHAVYVSREGYRAAEATVTGSIGRRENVSLPLRAEPIALTIRAPADAPLTLDGQPVAANTALPVAPGPHEIRYGESEPVRITLAPGEGARRVDVGGSTGAEGPPGLLAVQTNVESATVTVDGELIGTGRAHEAQVASGPRTIAVRAPGYAQATARIDVPAGGEARIAVRLEPDVSGERRLGRLPAVMWLVTGVTAAAATGIGIAALVTNGEYEDAGMMSPRDRERIQELYDRTQTLNTTADVLFGVTAALGITSLILTLLNGETEQPPSRIDLAATPIDGGGLFLARGSFGGAQ